MYDEAHLKQRYFVGRAREFGFPIGRIQELISLSSRDETSFEVLGDIAVGYLADIRQKILGVAQITLFRSYHGYHGQEPSQSLQTGTFDRAFRIGLDVIDGCPSVRRELKDVELILSSAT